MADDEEQISWCYNDGAMNEMATEDVVIAGLATIGVAVLLVLFVYVVKQIMTRKY